MLDLQWPCKRHGEVHAGIQRFAEEWGWVTIIDEFAHDVRAAGKALTRKEIVRVLKSAGKGHGPGRSPGRWRN